MKSPIFIFSLPRSGSTLLQRVLSGHSEIATAAEPWILLPLCYATRQEGILSEYSNSTSFRAISDFVSGFGKDEYNEELNNFVSSLYQKYCANGEIYFLDKTPRYYLIINDIKEMFPDAKFIFLFRNPLHIIGSIIDTFSSGGLDKMYHYEDDITKGFGKLSNGYNLLKNQSYSLMYEDFVAAPAHYIKEICTYLEIEYQSIMLDSLLERKITGRMGDSVRSNYSRKIDVSGLNKWEKSCSGLYRKSVVRSIIEKIPAEAFEIQGYSKNDIVQDIKSLNHHFRGLLKDFIQYKRGNMIFLFKRYLFHRRPRINLKNNK